MTKKKYNKTEIPLQFDFGGFLGDVGRTLLDTALTPVEAVTGKNFYDPKMQTKFGTTAAKVSNVVDDVTSAALPMVANAVAPGVGGLAVSAARGITSPLVEDNTRDTHLAFDGQREISQMAGMGAGILGANKLQPMMFEGGGNMEMTQYEGPSHQGGGIAVGKTGNEVEGGETRVEDYIFSDALKPEGNDFTFAQLSKKIERKYGLRKNDAPSNRAKAKELEALRLLNDEARTLAEQNSQVTGLQDSMNYGGMIKYENGGIFINPSDRNILSKVAKERGMDLQSFASKILSDKSKYSSILVKRNLGGDITNLHGTSIPNMFPTIDSNEAVGLIPNTPYQTTPEDLAKMQKLGYNPESTVVTHPNLQNMKSVMFDNYSKVDQANAAMDKLVAKKAYGGELGYNQNLNTNLNPNAPNLHTIGNIDYFQTPNQQLPIVPNMDYNKFINPNDINKGYSQIGDTRLPKFIPNPKHIEQINNIVKKAWGGGLEDPLALMNADIDEWNKNKLNERAINFPDVNIDPSVFGQQQPVFDASWDTSRQTLTPLDELSIMPMKKATEIPQTNNGELKTDFQPILPNSKSPTAGNVNDPLFGREEAALGLSNMGNLYNLVQGIKGPDKTEFERLTPELISLKNQRDLAAKDTTSARAIANENIRGNAQTSGQALANKSAANVALTKGLNAANLQSFMNEETTNAQIKNNANATNVNISMQEKIANEQNKGMADTLVGMGWNGLGTTSQGYLRDKGLSAENKKFNDLSMQVINQMVPNYKWGINPENDQYMLQFAGSFLNQTSKTNG